MTGKGFRPGASGNPGGRRKGLPALIQAQTRDGAELVEFMLTLLRTGKPSLRFEAACWLADRGFGKPTQTVEHTGDEGGPLKVALKWADDVPA